MNKKSNGFSLAWVLSLVAITSIISALATGIIIYNNNRVNDTLSYADLNKDKELNQFLKVYANIVSEYYEDVNKEELISKAIAAMMNYLGDDYTTYLNDTDSSILFSKLSGEYTGIGVAINNGDKSISKVYDETPASKAGIKEGDIIIGLNGEDTSNMSANDIVNLLKKMTTTFTLRLKRGDSTINVSLKNEKIISPSIEYKLLENTNIGYIYIETFSNTLDTQIKKALEKLENEGMTNLIIDVRNNTGGYLDAASKTAKLFLDKGKRIYSLNNKNEVTHYNDDTDASKDYKIAVLTNGNTASAAEILAAALKDSYGAVLVGEKTYGKGKVQQTMKLEDGSSVKYTSAYWLTPTGECIDRIGLSPDYPLSNEEIKNEQGEVINVIDRQLEKATDILSE